MQIGGPGFGILAADARQLANFDCLQLAQSN
jgi:hypothetical protein